MSTREANRQVLRKLLVVTVVMFGFGFALIPFYEKICEVTGINNLLQADKGAAENTQVDYSRELTIEFDSNVTGLPWQFKPMQTSIKVHPGQLAQVTYKVANTTGQPITGQAIPAYGPQLAGQHFRKLDCFCFTKQTLGPNEVREMPVVFVIDPSLPKDVNTITVSYTFFELPGAGKAPPG